MKIEEAPFTKVRKQEGRTRPEEPLTPKDEAVISELDSSAKSLDKLARQPAIQKTVDAAVKLLDRSISTTGLDKLWDALPGAAQRFYLYFPDPSGISELFNRGSQSGLLKLKDKSGKELTVEEYRAWNDRRQADTAKFVDSIAPPAAALLKGFYKIANIGNSTLNRAGHALESDKRQVAAKEQDEKRLAQIEARLKQQL